MRYQQLKEKLVVDDKKVDSKGLMNMVVKLGLMTMGICLTLGNMTLRILGVGFAIVMVFLSLGFFVTFLGVMCEGDENFEVCQKTLKYWWAPYIFLVVSLVVLRLFRF